MENKIIYPRYTREQNLCCKLSDEDIKELKEMGEMGYTRSEIAIAFNIDNNTAKYWLMTDEDRKQRLKHKYLLRKERGYFYKKTILQQRKNNKRKELLFPIVKKYRIEKALDFKKNNKELVKQYNRNWVKKHPEKVKIIQRNKYLRRKYKLLK